MILHYNESNQQDNEAAIELIKEKRLKGLICLGGNYDNLHNEEMQNLHIPIVLASTSSEELSEDGLCSSVNIDNIAAAFMAVNYICSLSHSVIGLITTGEGDKTVGKLRYEGYEKALKENSIDFNRELVEIGGYTFSSGYEAMNRLLDKDLKITAVFVTSDIMAIGASKAILNRGFKIPEDISVIGFDGIDYSLYFHPSITTIMQPVEAMGEKSIELLLDLINDTKKENEQIIFDTKLEERESCKELLRG
ncbi:MAG: substrate-binding domain-containing protein [Clostridium sp.]